MRSKHTLLRFGDAFAVLAGCDSAPEAAPAEWYGVVEPIVRENCSGCHSDGGIAPFPLTTYEEVSMVAQWVASAVEDRTMPPWLAGQNCNEYKDDISLSDAEIAAISSWADAGAPLGDPSKALPPPESEPMGELSRVDMTLGMHAAYTPTVSPDEYRCFVLDGPESNLYVTGLRAIPGNAAIVHHVVVFAIPPGQVDAVEALDQEDEAEGYTCFGSPLGGNGMVPMLGAWAPGASSAEFPDKTGLLVEAGSKIVIQLHYNIQNGTGADQTTLQLKTETEVPYPAVFRPFTSYNWVLDPETMSLPAQETTTHTFTQNISEPGFIHGTTLHMHTLGESGSLTLQRDGTDNECLLDIPRWDFHWQRGYQFTDPVEVVPGDQLEIRCTWDNTTDSEITWGEGTSDEMCLGFIYATADYE